MLISPRGLSRHGARVVLAGVLLTGCGAARGVASAGPAPAPGTPMNTPGSFATGPASGRTKPPEAGTTESPGPGTAGSPGLGTAGSPTAGRVEPPPGDGPPNYGSNNGWKYRAPLSAEDARTARAAAERIRPVLRRLRRANDLSADAVRRELLRLGHPPERVIVHPISPNPLSAGTTPAEAGAVYSVLVGRRACVDGDVRPSRLLLTIEGTIADGGCLEPFSH